MGLFFIDTSQENSTAFQRQRKEEIKDIAREIFESIDGAPDKAFPEFLWNPLLNEFDNDDYRARGLCDNPNVQLAYTIGRKYSDYWDYVDAMDIYESYVDYIEGAYGSFEMMKRASDDGLPIVYIPRKPKLTNKRKNKLLLQAGFIPSRVDEDFNLTEEQLEGVIDAFPIGDLDTDYDYRPSKEERKAFDILLDKKTRRDRLSSIYATGGYGTNQGIDAVISFINNMNSGSFEDRSIEEIKSFYALMMEDHEFENIPPEIIEYNCRPTSALVVNHQLVDAKTSEQLELLKTFAENGFNFLHTGVTAGMNKSAIRMITKTLTDQFGEEINYANLSPKEIKKLKKKEAKRREKLNSRLLGENRLQDTLLKNRVHLSALDNGAINMRLTDVIPNYD